MRPYRKPIVGTALLALTATAFLASSRSVPEGPAIGSIAPEIQAGTWFNQIGGSPTLESLRGHALLLEFWATW